MQLLVLLTPSGLILPVMNHATAVCCAEPEVRVQTDRRSAAAQVRSGPLRSGQEASTWARSL